MLLQSYYRLNWDDDQDYAPTLNLSDSFKKAFTGIPKLLASEISLDTCAVFEGTSILAGPSISYESLSIDSFPLHGDDQLYFTLDPDSDVLEFNETGHLIGAEERNDSSKQVLPPSDSAYYGGDLFVSWEDDIFAGALSISELPVQNPTKVASPALPVSPSFDGAVVETSLEIVEVQVNTPKKSKSKSPSRKRSTPSTGPSPKSSKPRSALKDSSSPKRQRRHSSKNSVTFALEPQILSFPLDREERAVPSPKLKKGKIGLLSSSTHQLSEAVIRNIFRAEQVVTLCKVENEDDEDVDIL
jgi:hypothetical protein